MKKMNKLVFTTALLATTAISANALAFYEKKKALDGFYIGGQAGYANAKLRVDERTTVGGVADSIVTFPNVGMDGFVGGVFGGFGWMFDKFYLGIEGEWDSESLQGGYHQADNTVAGGQNNRTKFEMDYSWGVGGRVGYEVVDNTMFYLHAGYSAGRLEFTNVNQTGKKTTSKKTLGGFKFGGGTEWMFNDNFGFRMDYAHIVYEDHTFKTSTTSFSETFKVDPNEDKVRVGVFFRF